MGRMKRQAGAAPQTMITLADLYRDGRNVACVCRQCDHRAKLATSDLIGFLGGTTTLRRISDRLRCRECGGRSGVAIPD